MATRGHAPLVAGAGSKTPRAPGWRLQQQWKGRPLCLPQHEQPAQPEQEHRVSARGVHALRGRCPRRKCRAVGWQASAPCFPAEVSKWRSLFLAAPPVGRAHSNGPAPSAPALARVHLNLMYDELTSWENLLLAYR
jgi:hypothetical protein